MTKQIDWEKVIESLKKDIMYYENLSFKQPGINSWFDRNAALAHVLEAIQKGLKEPLKSRSKKHTCIQCKEYKFGCCARLKNGNYMCLGCLSE